MTLVTNSVAPSGYARCLCRCRTQQGRVCGVDRASRFLVRLEEDMKYLLTTIGLLALLAAPAAGQTAQPGGGTAGSTMPGAKAKLSAQDRDFVKRAAIGGMAEVEEGKLAAQRAQNDAVKNFGQQMDTDHTKINADLQAIASRIGD